MAIEAAEFQRLIGPALYETISKVQGRPGFEFRMQPIYPSYMWLIHEYWVDLDAYRLHIAIFKESEEKYILTGHTYKNPVFKEIHEEFSDKQTLVQFIVQMIKEFDEI